MSQDDDYYLEPLVKVLDYYGNLDRCNLAAVKFGEHRMFSPINMSMMLVDYNGTKARNLVARYLIS